MVFHGFSVERILGMVFQKNQGSFLRKGAVFAYGGLNQSTMDLQDLDLKDLNALHPVAGGGEQPRGKEGLP